MLKIIEPTMLRNYGLNVDNEPIELCTEGYKLENGVDIMYISGKWLDYADNEYTEVKLHKELIGFNEKNMLDDVDKEMLSSSPEGRAYVKYNEIIGGERIGLEVLNGYLEPVYAILEAGGTIEGIYKECIQKGISWEELLQVDTRHNEYIVI